MRTLNFKSQEAYNKWLAHGHSRTKTGLKVRAKKGRVSVFKATPGNTNIKIQGVTKKVKHNMENKRGQMMMISILYFVMSLAILVGTLPLMKSLLDMAQQSDSLNCAGYYYNGDTNHYLSYNSSLSSDTLACIAIRLYLPYIVLVILVVGVMKIVLNRQVEATVV